MTMGNDVVFGDGDGTKLKFAATSGAGAGRPRGTSCYTGSTRRRCFTIKSEIRVVVDIYGALLEHPAAAGLR